MGTRPASRRRHPLEHAAGHPHVRVVGGVGHPQHHPRGHRRGQRGRHRPGTVRGQQDRMPTERPAAAIAQNRSKILARSPAWYACWNAPTPSTSSRIRGSVGTSPGGPVPGDGVRGTPAMIRPATRGNRADSETAPPAVAHREILSSYRHQPGVTAVVRSSARRALEWHESVVTMTALPYDPDNPPAEPPAGADRMTWLMAYRIFAEHQAGPDGTCTAATCRAAGNRWPCPPSVMARSGFADACRSITAPPGGDRWTVDDEAGSDAA